MERLLVYFKITDAAFQSSSDFRSGQVFEIFWVRAEWLYMYNYKLNASVTLSHIAHPRYEWCSQNVAYHSVETILTVPLDITKYTNVHKFLACWVLCTFPFSFIFHLFFLLFVYSSSNISLYTFLRLSHSWACGAVTAVGWVSPGIPSVCVCVCARSCVRVGERLNIPVCMREQEGFWLWLGVGIKLMSMQCFPPTPMALKSSSLPFCSFLLSLPTWLLWWVDVISMWCDVNSVCGSSLTLQIWRPCSHLSITSRQSITIRCAHVAWSGILCEHCLSLGCFISNDSHRVKKTC